VVDFSSLPLEKILASSNISPIPQNLKETNVAKIELTGHI